MWTLLAVAISASAYYASIGLGEFWPAAWIAPIPILLVAFRSSWRKSALAAFAAYFLGNLNLLTFLMKIMPAAIVVMQLALLALIYAGVILLTRFAARRLPPWVAPFVFPAAWTSCEFLSSLQSPHGTSLSLAYSQTDVLPLLQIASISGLWGVTFVVALVPSAIAAWWSRRVASSIVPALAILAVVLGYGVFRLQTASAQPAVRVGMAATDETIEAAFRTNDPAVALQVAHAYAARVAHLAAGGAQVVVLPEKLEGLTPADSDAVQQVFSAAARDAHVTLVAGFDRFTLRPRRNVAMVFGPDGRALLEYDKRHMLPGPETGYAAGATPGLFAEPGAQWGVAICKDMDFPAWSRGYGQRGVRILAVPAWDFVRDARQHSRMAIVRGVEEGFTMARAAQQGNLTFSDAYGRILAEAPSSQRPEAYLLANLAPGPGATLYTHFGNWFAWLCVISLAMLLAQCFRGRAATVLR